MTHSRKKDNKKLLWLGGAAVFFRGSIATDDDHAPIIRHLCYCKKTSIKLQLKHNSFEFTLNCFEILFMCNEWNQGSLFSLMAILELIDFIPFPVRTALMIKVCSINTHNSKNCSDMSSVEVNQSILLEIDFFYFSKRETSQYSAQRCVRIPPCRNSSKSMRLELVVVTILFSVKCKHLIAFL